MLQCLQHGVSRCVCGVRTDCDLYVPRAGSQQILEDDLWRLSLTTLEWTQIEVALGGARPSARWLHTMTAVRMDLWVYGGVSGVGEERSVCYSACNVECLGVFVECGDCDLCVPRSVLGDSDELWRMSLETLEWTRIEVPFQPIRYTDWGGTVPSGSVFHTMTAVGRDLWFHRHLYAGEDVTCVTRATRLCCCAEAECASFHLGTDVVLQYQPQV